jgi:serine/threonine protein kinase
MLMQKLYHKGIVEFTEAFETDEYVYVIMEHVEGQSLHEYLRA